LKRQLRYFGRLSTKQRPTCKTLLTSEEKWCWAKTLADTIGVLNKLLANQGEKQLEDEDPGTLLAKIPKTLRRTVMRRVHVWRRKNS